MSRVVLPMLLLSLLFANNGQTAKPSDNQEKAFAEITKLGGKVAVDEKSPGQPIAAVTLEGPRVTDDSLASLEEIHDLRNLKLWNTKITDAGFKHLKGLTQLRELSLFPARLTAP